MKLAYGPATLALVLLLCTGGLAPSGLLAQCPIPDIFQVIEGRGTGQILVTRDTNIATYELWRYGEGPVDIRFDQPDSIYRFDADVADGNLYLLELDTFAGYNIFLRLECKDGSVSGFTNRRFFRTDAGERPEIDREVNRGIIASATTRCVGRLNSTQGATNDGDSACLGDADDDVWFNFRPIYPAYDFEFQALAGDDRELVAELRTLDGDILRCATAPAGEIVRFDYDDFEYRVDHVIRVYTAGSGGRATFRSCAVIKDVAIADGAGCVPADTLTFDGTGAPDEFINILTPDGGLVAAVANTEDLGEVVVGFYDHGNDPLRSGGPNNVEYGARNIYIIPERQPTGPVRVRLFFTQDEVVQLMGIQNSYSGLAAITKVPNGACNTAYPNGGAGVSVDRVAPYGAGIYVDLTVDSFSDFYLHRAGEALGTPVSIRENGDDADSWAVYPNPVRDVLQLEAPESLANTEVVYELLRGDGAQVQRGILGAGPRRAVRVTGLVPGFYVLVLTAEGRRRSVRVMVR